MLFMPQFTICQANIDPHSFGIFIGLTIALATLFAFGLFCALLAAAGPVKRRDDIKAAYHWAMRKSGLRSG